MSSLTASANVTMRLCRVIAAITAVVLIWSAPAMTQTSDTTRDGPKDRIVAAHYPPLMDEFNGSAPGLAIEILEQAALIAGRQIDVRFLPFQRAMLETKTRDDTLMPALFRNEEREADFQWVALIQTARMKFVTTRAQVHDLTTARKLNLIAVERGSSTERFLKDKGFTNLFVTNDPVSSAQMLAAGRVDAWFLTERLIEKTWKSRKLKPDPVFGDVIHELPIYLVAGPDFPSDVAQAYSAAIKEMRNSGDMSRIIDQYSNLLN